MDCRKHILLTFVLLLFSSFIVAQELPPSLEAERTDLPPGAVLLENGTVVLGDGTIVDAITLQPLEKKDYAIQESDEGVIFIQTLSWEPSESAYRYEVIVEKQLDDDTWVVENTYESETEVSSVEVSLLAGTYRYSVLVYNFLDLFESQSEWFEFTIFKAIQPTVEDLSPGIIYLDEEQSGIFNVKTVNALENTSFSLEIPGLPRRTMFGTVLEQNNENLRVQFDMNRIDVGDYLFKVENPGGLTDTIEPLVVKFLKPYDFNITFGYNMFYTVPGDITYYFDKDFYPIGFNLKATYIPQKRNWGQIGFELSTYWVLMQNIFDTYTVSTHVVPVTLNFVYQYPIIKKRLVLDTHVGAGTSFLLGTQFKFSSGVESPSENVMGLTASTGIALQYYILNRLYIELGADYLVTLYDDTLLHQVVPSLSAGWQC